LNRRDLSSAVFVPLDQNRDGRPCLVYDNPQAFVPRTLDTTHKREFLQHRHSAGIHGSWHFQIHRIAAKSVAPQINRCIQGQQTSVGQQGHQVAIGCLADVLGSDKQRPSRLLQLT
jgi:hypothetical protein